MNEIKALVFDVDGTLIPYGSYYPSAFDVKLLNELAQDYILIVASGRHRFELTPLDAIHFHAYISCDGKVLNIADHEEIICLTKEDVETIVNFALKAHFPCVLTEKDDRYINFVNQTVIDYHQTITFDVPRLEDLRYGLNRDIILATLFESDAVIAELMPQLKHAKYIRWNRFAGDINDKSGGKEDALKRCLAYYNLKKEEVLCFGDGINDLTMFKAVAHSCAMGNACALLKEKAEFVTKDVHEYGLYYGLKHFGIIKETERKI